MTDDTATLSQAAFQLKGSLFTLSALQLKTGDLDALAKQLAATIEQSPNFFAHAPIVLDLVSLSSLDIDVDFAELSAIMGKHNLILVGVRGANPRQKQTAIDAGLAVFPNTKAEKSESENQSAKQISQATKVISQPVRSGQQIYAKGSDLLVLSSVSPGAELIADGHIHVYGTLRGRALAGVQGDTNARIFCQAMDPELIAIAGRYLVSENMPTPPQGNNVHIYLKDDKINISAI